MVLRPGDDGVLYLFGQLDENGTIAAGSYDQVLVLVRVFLGFSQSLPVYDGILHCLTF